jgi:hypothetical protein
MKIQLKRKSGTESVYVSITHEKENNWIFVDWNGFLKVDMVKEGSEELLKVIESTGCPNVLVDNSNVTGPWQQANSWYQNDWNPRAIQAGLRNMAVVVSDNVFAQLSLQGFLKISDGIYSVQSFNTMERAKEWLASRNVTA